MIRICIFNTFFRPFCEGRQVYSQGWLIAFDVSFIALYSYEIFLRPKLLVSREAFMLCLLYPLQGLNAVAPSELSKPKAVHLHRPEEWKENLLVFI